MACARGRLVNMDVQHREGYQNAYRSDDHGNLVVVPGQTQNIALNLPSLRRESSVTPEAREEEEAASLDGHVRPCLCSCS